jgi:hypothetical protein
MPSSDVKGRSCASTLVMMLLFIVLVAILKTHFADDPLIYIVPNFLMFTPFREQTKAWWKHVLHVDKAVAHEPTHIAVIEAENYNMEALRVATENFRYPAVVRGLFKGSTALEKWPQPGYLKSKIGEM